MPLSQLMRRSCSRELLGDLSADSSSGRAAEYCKSSMSFSAFCSGAWLDAAAHSTSASAVPMTREDTRLQLHLLDRRLSRGDFDLELRAGAVRRVDQLQLLLAR